MTVANFAGEGGAERGSGASLRSPEICDGHRPPLQAGVLYRCAAALIVVFWLAMTALLIRSEVAPAQSRMRELPPSHVLKLLFLHEQVSELSIQYQKTPVGRLRVHPQVRREDGTRTIDFVGNAQISLPGLSRERLSWEGTVEMTRQLVMQEVRLGLNVRGTERYGLEVTHDVPAGRGHYEAKVDDVTFAARDYSLDPAGREALLRDANVPPHVVAMLQAAIQSAGAQEPLVIAARQSTFELQGEPIDTVLVTFREGAQTLLDLHISQLGQVLRADSLLGYSFVAE
jgi:hypothetical protein